MLFHSNRFTISKSVLESAVTADDLTSAFAQFINGDWGQCNGHRSLMNDLAMTSGDEVQGVYSTLDGTTFVMRQIAEFTVVELCTEGNVGALSCGKQTDR